MALSMMPHARRRRTDFPLSPANLGAARLPTLVAPRVQLRWLESRDLDGLHAVHTGAEATRFHQQGGWAQCDDAAILLEAIHRGFEIGTLFQWGIALRGDDQLIGTCSLHDVDHGQGRAEIGFALAREHWGRRYAREALTVLLDHAFGVMDLRRIEADVDPRNQASLHTLEALGFRREGYLRQRWQVAGEVQDSVLMGLLASDWQASR